MAHNKVYGVCQNKCSVEVTAKSERFERVFYANPGPNCSVEIYRFKNMMLARAYGKLPNISVTIEYSEDIPCISGQWTARDGNNNGYIKAISESRQIIIAGSATGTFDCELFFLIEDEPTKAVCEVSRTELKTGDNLFIRANVENDNWNHTWQYKYLAKQISDGAVTTLKTYSNDPHCSVELTKACTKEFYVIARDENGNEYESNHVTVVCSV